MSFFFHSFSLPLHSDLVLDEDSSRHIAQVLRMEAGESLHVTNGRGDLLICSLLESHKKHCRVQINETRSLPPVSRRITLAVALLKNASRMEWLLEKTTEMGVHRIIPLQTHRTIKEKFRHDRMQGIITSAMLQSQQCWLPELMDPVAFGQLFQRTEVSAIPYKYIAHCLPQSRSEWLSQPLHSQNDVLILIGPEGDFTEAEIQKAMEEKCVPVALGPNRLRTETAAITAVAGYYLSNSTKLGD